MPDRIQVGSDAQILGRSIAWLNTAFVAVVLVLTTIRPAAAGQFDATIQSVLQGLVPQLHQAPAAQPPPAPYRQLNGAYPAPPRPAPAYAPPVPVIDREDAAKMQRMLHELGYDVGTPDGTWGERSIQALRAFQRDHGRPEGGELTPASRAEVTSAWQATERSATRAPTATTIGASAPSFSCAGALTASEAAICHDPELAGLDREVARAYAMASEKAPPNLAVSQRAWMRQRDACRANAACLRDAMAERVAVLQPESQASSVRSPTSLFASSQDTQTVFRPIDCASAKPGLGLLICRDSELSSLDQELARTYAAIANGADPPPQLEAEQRVWVERRGKCPQMGYECLRETYRQRLEELAAYLPETTTTPASDQVTLDSAKAAQLWGVPLLHGMPYLAGVRLIVLHAIGSAGFEAGYEVEHAAPAARAWTRMVYAMGLAASPEAVAKLDDGSLAEFACIFLEPAAQKQLSGGKSCDDLISSGSAAGTEFTIHDLAQGFKARELPQILKGAPRLPFRLLVTTATPLPHYDLATGTFKLFAMNPEGVSVGAFGTPSNTILRDLSWPVPEADARAIVQKKATDHSPELYLGTSLTITGTIVEDRPERTQFQGVSGLPYGTRWRIEGGDVTLYADDRLSKRLYAFTEQSHLPLPIAGTPAADAPSPASPPSLSDETALLLLLQAGKLGPDQIKWDEAADTRYRLEQQLARRTDWAHLDPWGLYFTGYPRVNTDLVAGYRAWSIRRSMVLPHDVVLHQTLSNGRALTIPVLGTAGSASILGDRLGAGQRVRDALAERGLSDANLVPVILRVPGADSATVLVAVPQPRDAFKLSLSAGQLPLDTGSAAAPPATLDVQLSTVGIEQLAKGVFLLRLAPKRATILNGDKTVTTVEFPHAEWPSPPPPQVAAPPSPTPIEHLVAAAYGPDVVGLRLGMTIQDAEQSIRQEMPVGRVLETPAPKAGQEDPPAWLHGHLFIAQDGKERIAVFEGEGKAAGRVVGVWRRMLVPRTDRINDQVLSAMSKKYGPPATAGSEVAWNARPITDYHCRSGRSATWETWVEDGKPVNLGSAVFKEVPELQTKYAKNAGTLADYDRCGPLLHVIIGNGSSGFSPGMTEVPVAVSLLDMGVMARLGAEPDAVPPPPPPPAMKF